MEPSARAKTRRTPRLLAVDVAALRVPSAAVDGARLMRPASGFASKHAAERQLKLQQQREQQQQRRTDELDAQEPVEGEWKTVISHGRRGRQLDRRAVSFIAGSSSSSRGPPPSPQLKLSASYDSVLPKDAGRRKPQRRKQPPLAPASPASGPALGESGAVPPPSFLGQVMFARRSSLQRLADELHVDQTSPKTAPRQRKNSPDAERSATDSTEGSGALQGPPQRHQRRSRHSEVAEAAGEAAGVASPTSHRSSGGDDAQPERRKCGDKRDFFFRNLDFEVRNQLQVDQVAEFSVTDYEMAARISKVVRELFGFGFEEVRSSNEADKADDAGDQDLEAPTPMQQVKCPIIVTDGTACVGGNVLSFCDHFAHVNAVEVDATRVQMLRHNLLVLGKANATCIHASYLDVMLSLEQDVVFLDPPWGGPEYKELSKVDLFLDDVPLHDICARLRGHAACVVLKVPSNFDGDKFAKNVPGSVVVHRDLKKMHLVVLDFRDKGVVE